MIRKLKKVMGFFLKRRKLFYAFQIAGIGLKGLKGTQRIITDQDDAWFFELARNCETVFDIGSNIGYMSLIAAIQTKNKSILLVDPNPEALGKAAQNLIINGFGFKSKFISAFVADNDHEQAKFYTVGSGEAGSMFPGHAETASAINSFYYINKKTIDSLSSEVNCIPDLVKIDVEGAENLVLKGAVKTAALQKTKFMVEMHAPPELNMLENATNVLKWVNENGYHAFYMKEASRLVDPVTIAHRGKCHLLLVPGNEQYPDYLKNIKQGSDLPATI